MTKARQKVKMVERSKDHVHEMLFITQYYRLFFDTLSNMESFVYRCSPIIISRCIEAIPCALHKQATHPFAQSCQHKEPFHL